MTTEATTVDAVTVPADASTTSNDLIPKSEAQKAFAVRDAEKARARALEEKLAKYEADAETRRQSEMTELDKLKEENAKLKTSASRVDTLTATIKSQVDSMIADIPEDKRSLIIDTLSPEQKLDYITKNRSLLMATPGLLPKPNTLQSGPAPAKPALGDLTDAQKAMCKRFKMSEEEYLKYR